MIKKQKSIFKTKKKKTIFYVSNIFLNVLNTLYFKQTMINKINKS